MGQYRLAHFKTAPMSARIFNAFANLACHAILRLAIHCPSQPYLPIRSKHRHAQPRRS